MEDEGPTVYDGAELTTERARFWLLLDGWQADEAVHLLCCIDPQALNRWAALNGGTVTLRFPAQFDGMLALLQRAGETGALRFPAAPGDVIRWAMSKSFKLPAPLIPAGAVARDGRWTDEATKAGEQLTEPAPAAAEPVPVSGDEWREQARDAARSIVKRAAASDSYPPQARVADEIAADFRKRGIVGADGKPLSGATIKRHALRGISSATKKAQSTTAKRGK